MAPITFLVDGASYGSRNSLCYTLERCIRRVRAEVPDREAHSLNPGVGSGSPADLLVSPCFIHVSCKFGLSPWAGCLGLQDTVSTCERLAALKLGCRMEALDLAEALTQNRSWHPVVHT